MFATSDKHFDEMAADPVRRRKGIRDLSFRRNLLFGCAMVTTLCAFSFFFIPSHSLVVPMVIGFVATSHWTITFKIRF